MPGRGAGKLPQHPQNHTVPLCGREKESERKTEGPKVRTFRTRDDDTFTSMFVLLGLILRVPWSPWRSVPLLNMVLRANLKSSRRFQ